MRNRDNSRENRENTQAHFIGKRDTQTLHRKTDFKQENGTLEDGHLEKGMTHGTEKEEDTEAENSTKEQEVKAREMTKT